VNEIDRKIESFQPKSKDKGEEGLHGSEIGTKEVSKEGSVRSKLCDKLDIGATVLKFQQLLLHREEATREAAVCVTGALIG
jgi:hypothetical protein